MTPDVFRAIALSFPKVRELQVLGSQEFRVQDRAFATLGWPAPGWAVVRLAPAEQLRFLASSKALSAEPGGRGRRGVTRVRLDGVDESMVQSILKCAWRQVSGSSFDADPG